MLVWILIGVGVWIACAGVCAWLAIRDDDYTDCIEFLTAWAWLTPVWPWLLLFVFVDDWMDHKRQKRRGKKC